MPTELNDLIGLIPMGRPLDDWESYIYNLSIRITNYSKKFSLFSDYSTAATLLEGRIAPELHTDLLKMMDIAENIFPGRWDLQYELRGNFKTVYNDYGHNSTGHEELEKVVPNKIYFVFHFPEITITNSQNNHHSIKDLYVRLPMEVYSNKFKFMRIQGTRTTQTNVEYLNGYNHSHLPAIGYHSLLARVRKVCEYSNFCTGDGEINMTQAMINADFTEDLFKSLLFQFESFLNWESIEGNPHIRMSNVTSKDYGVAEPNEHSMKNYWGYFLSHLKTRDVKRPNLTWKLVDQKVVLIDNATFNEFINDSITSDYSYLEDETGKPFKIKQLSTTTPSIPDAWIPFRKQKIMFNIIQHEQTQITTGTPIPHKILKNYVKSRLESKVTTDYIKEIATRTLSSSTHS